MPDLNSSIRIDIYSRPGCHLCEEAKQVIERVRLRYNITVHIINIDEHPQLELAYGNEIPVVFINSDKAFKYRVDETELERKLKRLCKA